jgi:hypothetical protein
MPVILVIIIAVAWMVILGPSLMKRRSRSVGEIGSISHFHRQLRVLEHSGTPPIVTPAYRLRSVDDPGGPGETPGQTPAVPILSVVGAAQLPRPALAFLGEDPGKVAAPPDRFETGTAGPVRSVAADDRFRVRKRRRDALAAMAAALVGTFLIGLVPGASAAWIVTVLCGVALAVYVALLVRVRRLAEERQRKLHYLQPAGSAGAAADHAAGFPLTRSGRYAHPSNQVAAAH